MGVKGETVYKDRIDVEIDKEGKNQWRVQWSLRLQTISRGGFDRYFRGLLIMKNNTIVTSQSKTQNTIILK